MTDNEADRLRSVDLRRAGTGSRYAYWRPENLFIFQSRERAVLRALRSANMLPLTGSRVLDVGCGDGAVLRDLLRYGAAPEDLHGLDLLIERVGRARALTPGATIDIADAQALNYEDGSFDLVLGFTLLSSVIEPEARARVASEMRRVTRHGGLVLLYDFWTNPLNRDVHPLKRDEVRSLFPGKRIDFQSTTLAPPLLRLLLKAPGGWIASSWLDVLPFLRTHYVAAVHV
jgi:SAM-dependent methyltransferase